MTLTPEKQDAPAAEDQPFFCYNHPTVETRLRCSKCGNPICIRCAKRTPVGFRCPQCVRNQQAVFYTATTTDYVLGGVAAFVLGGIGAAIMSPLGWFFAIFLGPLIGGGIGEAVWRVTGRRRGHWMGTVALVCFVLGALIPAAVVVIPFLVIPGLPLEAVLPQIGALLLRATNPVFVVLAAIAVYARLR